MSHAPESAVAAALLAERRSGRLSRRAFLGRMTALAVAGVLPEAVLAAGAPGRVSGAAWRAVAAAQAHMFPPGTDSPGAADVNATAYLQAVLLDPFVEPGEKRFIADGAGWLEAFVRREYGAELGALGHDAREEALRRIEAGAAGRDWLALVLYYVFEALLTDPVYGGNPGGVGWRWLEHQPGFPRPPADKRYFDLV